VDIYCITYYQRSANICSISFTHTVNSYTMNIRITSFIVLTVSSEMLVNSVLCFCSRSFREVLLLSLAPVSRAAKPAKFCTPLLQAITVYRLAPTLRRSLALLMASRSLALSAWEARPRAGGRRRNPEKGDRPDGMTRPEHHWIRRKGDRRSCFSPPRSTLVCWSPLGFARKWSEANTWLYWYLKWQARQKYKNIIS